MVHCTINNCILSVSGAREASFRNIKTISECLADELINAAKVSVLCDLLVFINFFLLKGSSNSYAIKKKDELERVAKSNR